MGKESRKRRGEGGRGEDDNVVCGGRDGQRMTPLEGERSSS